MTEGTEGAEKRSPQRHGDTEKTDRVLWPPACRPAEARPENPLSGVSVIPLLRCEVFSVLSVPSDYSERSATIGLTLNARRTGTMVAARATSTTPTMTLA